MIEQISVYSHRTMLSNRGIVQIQYRRAEVFFVQKAQSSLLTRVQRMYVCMYV